jgi:thiamine-phosphate pyrophosphorylase
MSHQLPRSPFLYPIVDAQFSADPAADIEQLARAGVKILQFRAKEQSEREIFTLISRMVDICSASNVLLIVNDRVGIALLTNASGVHLGQEDFPVDHARSILGDSIIGLSTHNPKQFFVAQNSPIDYIALGPIYETTTKKTSDPVLRISTITPLLQRKSRPVVAIGGIRMQNFEELVSAGFDGIALISELYKYGNVYDTACRLLDELRKYEKV